jgi:predicted SAM-dependent methyltransferase
VDQIATGPGVITCDLRTRLCFADDVFDGVYHSNVLEHIEHCRAPSFLRECLRVLKPGGVLRVVVPDMEGIARAYLQSLDDVGNGISGGQANHEWMQVELLDQMVRTEAGGEMLRKLSDPHLANRAFVVQRLGEDARVEAPGNRPPERQVAETRSGSRWVRMLRHPRLLREVVIRRLLGLEYGLLQLGRFRSRGEVHQWMYDRVSLRQLLERTGFVDIRVVAWSESAIPDWQTYVVESDAPALRMEGKKPGKVDGVDGVSAGAASTAGCEPRSHGVRCVALLTSCEDLVCGW